MAQRPPPATFSIWLKRAASSTGALTVAVARSPRSDCTSATANLTGPSPNTCSTRAPLNLMFDCMSTAAAAISPAGSAPARDRRPYRHSRPAVQQLRPGIGQTHEHAAHGQAIEKETCEVQTQGSRKNSIQLAQTALEAAGIFDVMQRAHAQSVHLLGVSWRTTLAGLPMIMEPSGETLPSVTRAPAPTRQFLPILRH